MSLTQITAAELAAMTELNTRKPGWDDAAFYDDSSQAGLGTASAGTTNCRYSRTHIATRSGPYPSAIQGTRRPPPR